MKIGILTHPQTVNYGGILQCYALCTILRKMGHEPIVIRREADRAFFLWEWTRSLLKYLHFPRYYSPNKVDRELNIRPFVQKYIKRTLPVRSQSQMFNVCHKYNLEAVIVGSDQVWRKDYALKFGYNYFLDFVPDNILKMSYAASLGLSKWLYNKNETIAIKKLLSKYSGISVRESEAIDLLMKNVGLTAYQHVDPTLLLTAEEYASIMSKRLVEEDYIFVYWLGNKEAVMNRIEELEKKGKKVVSIFLRDNIEHTSIENWLSYIKYADSVITDSFHGSVFSIIFEKQFTVLKNDSGGNGRIFSLCEMFGIESDSVKNYACIKTKFKKIQDESYVYLQKTLKSCISGI